MSTSKVLNKCRASYTLSETTSETMKYGSILQPKFVPVFSQQCFILPISVELFNKLDFSHYEQN